jgi:ApaG protein
MHTAVTEGVLIRVQPKFMPEYSSVENMKFFFKYHVEIENLNSFPVQLISRDWYIFDSLDLPKIVSGEGVVGEQPILKPRESYAYNSACELSSEIGYMTGHYTFKNLETNSLFPVLIPRFELYYPVILN